MNIIINDKIHNMLDDIEILMASSKTTLSIREHYLEDNEITNAPKDILNAINKIRGILS